jgi:anti-anti-sigma factor
MSETPAPAPITIERTGSAVVARVPLKMLEEKDLKVLGQLVDQSAADPGVTVVVLDLSRVTILPSLGLGALIQISNKCKARQQRLLLASVSPQLRQVFAITRLDRVLEMSESVEKAVE